MDAGSLGPHVQAKSTATLSDLLSMYKGRVLKKSTSLSLTPDEQSDYDEANEMSGDNQTAWHSTQNNMPSSHILSSIVTKEKSCVQSINTAVKVEEGNPKKVDYIDRDTRTILIFFFFFINSCF